VSLVAQQLVDAFATLSFSTTGQKTHFPSFPLGKKAVGQNPISGKNRWAKTVVQTTVGQTTVKRPLGRILRKKIIGKIALGKDHLANDLYAETVG